MHTYIYIYMILLMEEIRHQLRLVVSPIIYKVSSMPGGFVSDFWTINGIICETCEVFSSREKFNAPLLKSVIDTVVFGHDLDFSNDRSSNDAFKAGTKPTKPPFATSSRVPTGVPRFKGGNFTCQHMGTSIMCWKTTKACGFNCTKAILSFNLMNLRRCRL